MNKKLIPKVIFKFDKEKDLENIWDTANSTSDYGMSWKESVTENIHEICDKKKFEECKKELEKTMKYVYANKIVKIIGSLFAKAWKEIEQEYFARLEKIMNSPFYTKKIIANLTTAGRCPYDPDHNPPSFFVNLFWGVPVILEVTGHELMHIQFHNSKYWNLCEKELGFTKTHDLKEALTILLDLEFRDLWIIEDGGYASHKKLREYIAKEWKKEKNFDKLINNSIKWIKKNGIK